MSIKMSDRRNSHSRTYPHPQLSTFLLNNPVCQVVMSWTYASSASVVSTYIDEITYTLVHKGPMKPCT